MSLPGKRYPHKLPTAEVDIAGRVVDWGRQLFAIMPPDVEFVLVLRGKGGGRRSYLVGSGTTAEQMQLVKDTAEDRRSQKSTLTAGVPGFKV